MAQSNKSVATLRISGDDLVPEEITRLLGVSPTHAQTKGQVFVGEKTGSRRVANCGMWRLCAADQEPDDVDTQISEILAALTSDSAVWRDITSRYDVDLFCGFFLGKTNSGFSLSPQSLAALGDRGIEISFDIYSPDQDEIAPRT
jgi:ribosomal protein L19